MRKGVKLDPTHACLVVPKSSSSRSDHVASSMLADGSHHHSPHNGAHLHDQITLLGIIGEREKEREREGQRETERQIKRHRESYRESERRVRSFSAEGRIILTSE
eukprot:sb/3477969/